MALAKNAKRCLNRQENNINEAPLGLVWNPLSRGEFLDANWQSYMVVESVEK